MAMNPTVKPFRPVERAISPLKSQRWLKRSQETGFVDLKRFVAPFSPPTTTLIDSLRYWTEQQPQEVAYYYTDGEDGRDEPDL